MNQLLLYCIFVIFFIFTKENIIYQDFSPQCKIIEEARKVPSPLQPTDYVINTEFCIRHNAQLSNEKKCCHIILVNDEDLRDFCGIIEKSEYDNITKAFERLNDTYDNILPIYKEIKIDCFSKNLEFMITTFIIYLTFLIESNIN